MIRKLSMIAGAAVGTAFVLTEECVGVGRAPENRIHLDSDDVSRQHALLTRVGEDYRVRDLNSANGTFINDQRITERTLKHGDVLRFGGQTFRYEFSAGREPDRVKLAVPQATPVPMVVRHGSRGWEIAGGLVTFLIVLVVLGLAILGLELRWPAAVATVPTAATIAVPVAPPVPVPVAYRDPHGRFVCSVPVGWQVVAATESARSNVRLVGDNGDEIRVIAQPAAAAALTEEDRQTAIKVFGEALERARLAGGAGQLVGVRWRQIDAQRVLEIELEMRLPEYLWMRQMKWRSHGIDHTLAAYAGAAERQADLATRFEDFLQRYRRLPAATDHTVAP